MGTSDIRERARLLVLESCKERFPEPQFEVDCDASGTVWIKHVPAGRSVGVQPWQLRGRTIEQVVERAAAKLGVEGTV